MPNTYPATSNEVRDSILEDIECEALRVGIDNPPVQDGTDWHMAATVWAKQFFYAYCNIAARDKNRLLIDANGNAATGKALDDYRVAFGLPEVKASPATGRIVLKAVTGTRTVPKGTKFTIGAIRYETNETKIGAVKNDEVEAIALDVGEQTNQEGGTKGSFTAPPNGVGADIEVSRAVPLRNGADAEDDERKLERILNKLRYSPAAGNIGQLRELAFEALPSLQNAFVYCALGGPSTAKLVLLAKQDPENSEYSRVVDSGAVQLVRDYAQARLEEGANTMIQSVADELADVALQLKIPQSSLSGGNGSGWTDSVVWPDLVVADGGRVAVSTVTSSTAITVAANTTVSPAAGQTTIAWWASNEQRFYSALVTAVAGSAGAWQLTLSKPLIDKDGTVVAVGDYISPDATHIVDYGSNWLVEMGKLGPGENTADGRLPRSQREPTSESGYPTGIVRSMIKALCIKHAEIEDFEFAYRSKSEPTVPALVKTAPNVLVMRHFGVYEL